jgi:hypothetical protein
MKSTEYDGTFMRSMLYEMLTNKDLLNRVDKIDYSLFEQSYVRLLVERILRYHHKYKEAPGMDMLTEVSLDPSMNGDGEVISRLVESFRDEEPVPVHNNSAFMADKINEYLDRVRLEKAINSVKATLGRGDVVAAVNEMRGIKTSSPSDSLAGYTIDKSSIKRAFAENELQPVIEFGGDMGIFFNRKLIRSSLIAVQASEKKGKTWLCIDFAYKAFKSRRKVAIFQTGDLGETELTRRILMKMCVAPLWPEDCGDIEYPVAIELVKGDEGKKESRVTTMNKRCNSPITEGLSNLAEEKFCRDFHLENGMGSMLRMYVCPSNSINVRGIEAVLDYWMAEYNFWPDVIIVDYADILAPEDLRGDPKERWNDTWLALNRLRQSRKACVIVPTQANAESYDAVTMGAKHFSRDKRKYAHATAVLGLNQTPSEKEQGIMRLNWLFNRGGANDPRQCLHVAQCMKLGRMFCEGILD